ncbi:MAG: hypothetical protein EDM03_04775 [Porphyrobacter sp. IPPAS B-1204]|nr:MAG: hypothetical protein EDM03_04775 [Porphyrobacter sp. IPPAS B-1204]
MKLTFPFRAALAGLALAASAACSETAAQTQPAAQPTSEVDAKIAELFAEGPTQPRERPDFSNETVLKLNPIVGRAKAALDRYDELTPQLAAAREGGDKTRISEITAEFARLKAETDAANTAFQAEKKALLGRGEYYNEVVLAAMEQFVAEAPAEIAEALTQSGQ